MGERISQNPFGMRSISEANALGVAEDMKKRIFTMDWVFNKWWEKIFLVICSSWTVYSLFKFISGLF